MRPAVQRRTWACAAFALVWGTVAIAALGGCGRTAPTGAGRTARVAIGVQFAAGGGPGLSAIPVGIDSMEFTSWAEVGGGEQLLSSEGFRVDATTTEIHLDLRVPLATGYRVTGAALGVRDRAIFPAPARMSRAGAPPIVTGGNPTLYGIQFYRSQSLDAGLGPAVSLELAMEDVVPRAVRLQVPVGDSLFWPPVPAARLYVVRAYNFSGGPSIDFPLIGTAMVLPVGTGSYYRVRSELGNGLSSAFSEIP